MLSILSVWWTYIPLVLICVETNWLGSWFQMPELGCRSLVLVINWNHLYVTGFGKTCIVHTSNFSTLETHKIYLEWQIHVKLLGIVEPLFLHHSWKFLICIPFAVGFVDLQMSKIWCVNYARFPKSSHIYSPSQLFFTCFDTHTWHPTFIFEACSVLLLQNN